MDLLGRKKCMVSENANINTLKSKSDGCSSCKAVLSFIFCFMKSMTGIDKIINIEEGIIGIPENISLPTPSVPKISHPIPRLRPNYPMGE
jgi:hypothetical protein